MRSNSWDLTGVITKELSTLGLSNSEVSSLASMELFIYGCQKVDLTLTVIQSWSIIVGYNIPILKDSRQETIAYRLRILFPELRSKKILEKRLLTYLTIDRKYRLYDVDLLGAVTKITPRFITNRDQIYDEIIHNPIPRQNNSIALATLEKYEYSRIVRGGHQQKYYGKIPGNLIKDQQILPSYRPKASLKLSLPYNWLALAEQMDIELNEQKSVWTKRAQNIILKAVNRNSSEFIYKGNQHIGGGLAAGKSTFMIMETYRVVKQQGARVGFIEGSVSQVLERVKDLRALGINAVPIIGKSSRMKHQGDYLFANANDIHEISNWTNSKYAQLSHLSDLCIIKGISNDYERNSTFPCMTLKQDGKSVKCPLANKCGVYRDLTELVDADVWVATTASVLKIRIPAMIDPFERTVYEAMYDLLDVVFVDEADEVQKQFDAAFLAEYNVFGKVEDIFERLLNESNQLTVGQYEKFAGDTTITEWKDKLRLLDHMIWRIYRKLNHSETLRKNISRALIRVAGLADRISDKLSANIEDQNKIYKMLKNYAEDPYKDKLLANLVDELIEMENVEEKQQLLQKCMFKLKGQVRPRIKQELLYAELEFFLYLCRAEDSIKYVLTTFPTIHSKLGISSNISPLFSMQKDYQPFMKEAMTGMMIGYKYDLKDGETVGKFKLVEYIGIGRLLLQDWNQIYEASDHKKGPAIVFLSGTSYAPKSAHYNLSVASEWILEADRASSEVTMAFKPFLDPDSAEFYNISGISDDEERGNNLFGMVQQLKSDIQYELEQWNNTGDSRRVLLVVNSYEDVDHVAKAFSSDNSWIGRYKILSRDRNQKLDHYPRTTIEAFYKDKADVLVVPLLSIGRGYNILNREGSALFGSVFFLVRPYPIPNDMNYLISVLHAYLPEYLERIVKEKLNYDKAINKLRSISNAKFENMYKKPDFWSILNDKEREIMAWYTFVPVWQMIGRLLRGGKNARVFYCDHKFDAKPENKPDGESMLDCWQKLMTKNAQDPVFQSLYKPFSQGIQNMKREGLLL